MLVKVDGLLPHGVTAKERHLAGKPAPDGFLEGAREIGVDPGSAAVFEDALAGVAAGRAGPFGWVVGVDRLGGSHGQDLLDAGADTVVTDLDQLLDGAPAVKGIRPC